VETRIEELIIQENAKIARDRVKEVTLKRRNLWVDKGEEICAGKLH
jgi:hypothetical protein